MFRLKVLNYFNVIVTKKCLWGIFSEADILEKMRELCLTALLQSNLLTEAIKNKHVFIVLNLFMQNDNKKHDKKGFDCRKRSCLQQYLLSGSWTDVFSQKERPGFHIQKREDNTIAYGFCLLSY
jgi:hypothetical protein